MQLNRLHTILKHEPKYRTKQILQAILRDGVEKWEDVTTLPKELRAQLEQECPLEIPAEIYRDGKSVAKAVMTLNDGSLVETVLMQYSDRHSVCVSSQVGCPLGCKFCATGKLGYKRNLKSEEILEQVILWQRYLPKGERVTHVVFMGMGEPLLNYDNVMEAVRTLNSPEGFGIAARHIAISTVGIVPGIERLMKEDIQLSLAFSLHIPDAEERSEIMPVNDMHPLLAVLKALHKYTEHTKRKVMIEYIMLKDINDKREHAEKLAFLLKKYLGHLCMVNLIAYNMTGDYEASEEETIQRFAEFLRKQGFEVSERFRMGRNVDGACGQLAGKKFKE